MLRFKRTCGTKRHTQPLLTSILIAMTSKRPSQRPILNQIKIIKIPNQIHQIRSVISICRVAVRCLRQSTNTTQAMEALMLQEVSIIKRNYSICNNEHHSGRGYWPESKKMILNTISMKTQSMEWIIPISPTQICLRACTRILQRN